MNAIIAGRFAEQAQADQAIEALLATGLPRDQIAMFFCNPAGPARRRRRHIFA